MLPMQPWLMRPRTYALTLMTASAALFLTVIAANLIIDPQSVFGTGVVPPSSNLNFHYQRLTAYQAAADRYDGVLLGSSRTAVIPLDALSQQMDGARFADFGVAGGMVPDNLPALEYILRDKAARGQRVKAVFLLLDIDSFGNPAATNASIQTLLPPALSGDNPVRFWWRNLAALQPSAWRLAISEARGKPDGAPENLLQARLATLADFASARMARDGPGPKPEDPQVLVLKPKPFAQRAHFGEQLKQLERIVVLCRENGITLAVAISPLHRVIESLYDPAELSRAIDRIAGVVPVWDFTRSDWLSDDPARWLGDTSHFDGVVAAMMLRRMFGEEMPPEWTNFGRLRTRAGISAAPG